MKKDWEKNKELLEAKKRSISIVRQMLGGTMVMASHNPTIGWKLAMGEFAKATKELLFVVWKTERPHYD